MYKKIFYLIFLVIIITSCANNKKKTTLNNSRNQVIAQNIEVPEFNADSAWSYINNQVNFGPRVPNTDAHRACAKYLSDFFSNIGADVIEQKTQVTAYNNSILQITNIIAQFDPTNTNRIILSAHWDTRPYADHDEDSTLWRTPIDGANDGGSGVGVLMEIARHFIKKAPSVGIDIILFDAEDYGEPDFDETYYPGDNWCLGSQYWAKNLHKKNYYAKYCILLDMVGAADALLFKEEGSVEYAPELVNKVWKTASRLGFDRFFIKSVGDGVIIDDHLYIYEIAHIPSIDIVEHDPESDSYFGKYWHTHKDNMEIINRETLKAVGQTLLQVIYEEK